MMRFIQFISAMAAPLVITSGLFAGCSDAVTNCEKLGSCEPGESSSSAGGDGAVSSGGSGGGGSMASGGDVGGSMATGGGGAGSCQLADNCPKSCQAVLQMKSDSADGKHWIDPDGPNGEAPFQAYCNMTEFGGGWTLAMKIDGTSDEFNYAATVWTDSSFPSSTSINVTEEVNARFESWNTISFNDIMVGMRASKRPLSLPILLIYRKLNLSAANLHELFNESYQKTHLSREKWLDMITDMTIQANCDKEGVNVEGSTPSYEFKVRVRLGILGNQQNDCKTPNSYVGLGGQVFDCEKFSERYAAGNMDCHSSSTVTTPAFAVLFIR